MGPPEACASCAGQTHAAIAQQAVIWRRVAADDAEAISRSILEGLAIAAGGERVAVAASAIACDVLLAVMAADARLRQLDARPGNHVSSSQASSSPK